MDSSRLLDLPHRTGLRWLASVARLARPWQRIRRAAVPGTYDHNLRLATLPASRPSGRIQLPPEWDGPLVG